MSVHLHPKMCVCGECQALGTVRAAFKAADTYFELRRRNEARRGLNVIPFPIHRIREYRTYE